jgi:putative membrane protein
MNMLTAAWKKNDKKARIVIFVFSGIVFAAIMALSRVKWNVDLGFDVHLFAKANAIINSCVTLLLIVALIAVKAKNYKLHRNIMLAAMFLSVLFLISYICHHLFAGETRFGDVNHDGILSEAEKAAVGSSRMIYYILLGTHIPLAGIILPFILFSAYRALTGEFDKHKKLVRITWPIWFYVAVTGVVVYWMISPYYL